MDEIEFVQFGKSITSSNYSSEFFRFSPGEREIRIDGNFTIEQLEQIIEKMKGYINGHNENNS